MRILIVAALMGTVTGLWLQRSGTDLSEAELGKIRGNQAYYCGYPYPYFGGCTVCKSLGNITVTYSYTDYNGNLHTWFVSMPVFKKCNNTAEDGKCWVSSTNTDTMCQKTTGNSCGGAATGYMDATCTQQMAVQPVTGLTCFESYSATTSLPQTGVNCANITQGLF